MDVSSQITVESVILTQSRRNEARIDLSPHERLHVPDHIYGTASDSKAGRKMTLENQTSLGTVFIAQSMFVHVVLRSLQMILRTTKAVQELPLT
jgi:hypothetical protein